MKKKREKETRAGQDIWMSRLPPETLPIWQHLIIMVSGRSGELWGLLSRGEKWNHSSITHHPSLAVSHFQTKGGASICRGQQSLLWLDGSGSGSSGVWRVDCLGQSCSVLLTYSPYLQGVEVGAGGGYRLRPISLRVSCHDCSLGLLKARLPVGGAQEEHGYVQTK